jgi:hypothetical protein
MKLTCSLEDNIKRDHEVIGYESVDLILLTQHKMVGTFEHGNEASDSLKSMEFVDRLHSTYHERPYST